jgi:4'-phosphopantetheinyl transferase EntD
MTLHSNQQMMVGAWKSILPTDVEVEAGPLNPYAPSLSATESKSLGPVGPGRLLELQTGRLYAKRALSAFGQGHVELPVLPDRSPAWPVGVMGSITHVQRYGASHCAVAVGSRSRFFGLGIDAEHRATILAPEVLPTFLTSEELRQLRAFDEALRAREALHRWCVKEAVTKALHTPLDPLQIQTERSDTEGSWQISGIEGTEFNPLGKVQWSIRSADVMWWVIAGVTIRPRLHSRPRVTPTHRRL